MIQSRYAIVAPFLMANARPSDIGWTHLLYDSASEGRAAIIHASLDSWRTVREGERSPDDAIFSIQGAPRKSPRSMAIFKMQKTRWRDTPPLIFCNSPRTLTAVKL